MGFLVESCYLALCQLRNYISITWEVENNEKDLNDSMNFGMHIIEIKLILFFQSSLNELQIFPLKEQWLDIDLEKVKGCD